MKRKIQPVLIIAAAVILSGAVYLSGLDEGRVEPIRILDREGVLLRESSSSCYGTAYKVNLEKLPQYVIDVVLVTEDKRFFIHPGIDIPAILRAVRQNYKAKRIVSGGSTITQQLVRNIYRHDRKLKWKIIEALRALCIEIRYSKKRILAEYLNRIPYGNGAFGIEAASGLYFSKRASELTLAEAAFLTAIPGATNVFNPYKNFKGVKKRQKRILLNMYKKDKISGQDYENALNEKLHLFNKKYIFRAPHFCDYILRHYGQNTSGDLLTTLDLQLQKNVELVVKNHIAVLENANVTNASVIVVDNVSGDILSMVGSADYYNERNSGQVNGAVSLRQPGSTMKPFVYGTAIETGRTCSELLPDIESHIKIHESGFFVPGNYDKKYHGPVRFRKALACSYNVATLNLAETLGEDLLLLKLHEAGFYSLEEKPSYYGITIALGSGEITLLELARAYSGLARSGMLKSLNFLKDEVSSYMGVFFSKETSYILADILSDNNARVDAFGMDSPLNLPFRCAVKTGTSKNFKDNWAVGYTPNFTTAVWTGNFNGEEMKGVSGISGAAPILRDVMFLLENENNNEWYSRPENILSVKVCEKSGELPGPYCKETADELFIKGTAPESICEVHRKMTVDIRHGRIADPNTPAMYRREKVYEIYPPVFYDWMVKTGMEMPAGGDLYPNNYKKDENSLCGIISPRNGEIYKLDNVLRREYQAITLKPDVGVNADKLIWHIDGRDVETVNSPFFISWKLEKGRHRIKYTAYAGGQKICASEEVYLSVF